MKFEELTLKDAFIFLTESHIDNRGIFEKLFSKNEFDSIGIKKEIVEVNHSITRKKYTIRGMHFQKRPFTETKIIKCLKGRVFDVMIDLRGNSKTFLKWYGLILSEDNYKMAVIPDGFAHGFQTLTNNCHMLYFHTEIYKKEYEEGIRYDDPIINIQWKHKASEISDKDKNYILLDENFKGI